MVQLSDDCFAKDGALLPLDEALALIDRGFPKIVGDETLPIGQCLNRILAENVMASINVPATDNSAVDGYAVYFDDLNEKDETRRPIIGRAAAGLAIGAAQKRGTALRIFTGAAMPAGPDTVLMQEDCRVENDTVIIPAGIKRGANRRAKGEDIAIGDPALVAGRRLQPQDLALAAAIGRQELKVAKRLRVGIFSTGDELIEPGHSLSPGLVYDSNRRLLAAFLASWGAEIEDFGILKDDRKTTAERLKAAAAKVDLLMTSGGVSVGEEDHVRGAIEDNGRLTFWKLAIKPGRPITLGEIRLNPQARHIPIIGLPGNPVGAFVTLAIIARAAFFKLIGGSDFIPPRFPVVADLHHRKKRGRKEWVRAKLLPSGKKEGKIMAKAFPRDGAGILSSLTKTDGLAEIGEDRIEVAPGDMVDFIPYTALF